VTLIVRGGGGEGSADRLLRRPLVGFTGRAHSGVRCPLGAPSKDGDVVAVREAARRLSCGGFLGASALDGCVQCSPMDAAGRLVDTCDGG